MSIQDNTLRENYVPFVGVTCAPKQSLFVLNDG